MLQGETEVGQVTSSALGCYFLLLLFQLHVLSVPPQLHDLGKVAKEGLTHFEWSLLAFQACIAAPILEELAFRGVLQGWLRRASLAGHVMVCLWTLFLASYPLMAALEGVDVAPPLEVAWQALAAAVVLVGVYAWLFVSVWRGVLREGPAYLLLPTAPGRQSERSTDADDEPEVEEEEDPIANVSRIDPVRWREFEAGNVRLSMLGSAMFFAVVHSFAWPSPIPLFFLGLALAWLARRTQSLIGPMVMHACFNAVALGALLLLHNYDDRKGNAATEADRPGEPTVTIVPASHEPRFK